MYTLPINTGAPREGIGAAVGEKALTKAQRRKGLSRDYPPITPLFPGRKGLGL